MITATDDINGGLPSLGEGLRWSVYRDKYGVLNVALQQERRILGFFSWKTLYEDNVTHYMDAYYGKNQSVEQMKASTVEVANNLLARYNKAQAHEDAKRKVEELFKEAL